MTVEYLLGDHLGSTSLTTDASGAKVSEIRYKAWGEIRATWTASPSTTPAYKLSSYTFTGQFSYMDDPTTSGTTEGFGLMFYNARWYDPYLNRFTQADTLVPDTNLSQSWDRYAYVGNNPVKNTDPDGRCWPLCTMLIGAGIGAVASVAIYAGVSALTGHEITWGGVAGAALSGGIAGAVAGVAGPIAGTLMSAAGVAVTAESLAVGTAVVNGVVGASAYVEGTALQNAIDVPNGEQPVPYTVEGVLTAGVFSGVASYTVSLGNPPVSQNSILQASYFAPGRTWNSVFSIGAQGAYRDFAAGAVQGTLISDYITAITPTHNRCTENDLVCIE